MSSAHTGWVVGGGVMAVAIAVATACSADVHSAAPPASAAVVAAATTAAPTSSPEASTAPSTAPAATSSTPPPMPAAEAAATRDALAALAKRLPASLVLTPPATWARYAAATPSSADDSASCPRVATALGAALGAKWTYATGMLPAGPIGCEWTPAPWVPDRPPADRLFVTLGFQPGSTADLSSQQAFCAQGTAGPTLAVPTVGPGAVLDGCLDENGTALGLSFADPAGTGVWTIGTSGGVHEPPARAANALLALVQAARKAYR